MTDIYIDKDPSSQAFESLICVMLRGRHTDKMNAEELRSYINQAGVAIHNIPHFISKGVPLDITVLTMINNLDPSSFSGFIIKKRKWGDWVQMLTPHLIKELPILE